MITIKIAEYASEFAAVKKLRKEIFCQELLIQEDGFIDPYDDNKSLVFVLNFNSDLIGTARIVYSYSECEFYFSYLLLCKSFRRSIAGIYLLGGLLYFMECSKVSRICAHAHGKVESLYLKFGFKSVGQQFYKAGFNCPWTKMVYYFGTNGVMEKFSIDRIKSFINPEIMRTFYTSKQNMSKELKKIPM